MFLYVHKYVNLSIKCLTVQNLALPTRLYIYTFHGGPCFFVSLQISKSLTLGNIMQSSILLIPFLIASTVYGYKLTIQLDLYTYLFKYHFVINFNIINLFLSIVTFQLHFILYRHFVFLSCTRNTMLV